MRDQPPVALLLQVGLVDMRRREVAGNAGEAVTRRYAPTVFENVRRCRRSPVEVTHALRLNLIGPDHAP